MFIRDTAVMLKFQPRECKSAIKILFADMKGISSAMHFQKARGRIITFFPSEKLQYSIHLQEVAEVAFSWLSL